MKLKEWETLRESFYLWRNKRHAQQELKRVRRIHDLEQEIERLEGMPFNLGRLQATNDLRKSLDKILKET